MDFATMRKIMNFLIIFLIYPSLHSCQKEYKLRLPPPTVGPEALAFDRAGDGPYTGVSDGRVLKYINKTRGFVGFATTIPSRPKQLCDGNTNPAVEPTCGRPLGLGFDYGSDHLYIAEPYRGLVRVGPEAGIATLISNSSGGVPYKFLNALDIHKGVVYFIDSSTEYQRSEYLTALSAGDKTGRLLKYDPKKKQVTTLLTHLGLPVGTAVSKDGRFVLITLAVDGTVIRYWLKGPKASTAETFATLHGQPDNIRRNRIGEFWFVVNEVNGTAGQSVALRIDESGNVKETFQLNNHGKPVPQYSEFQESRDRHRRPKYYAGSLSLEYVGVYL